MKKPRSVKVPLFGGEVVLCKTMAEWTKLMQYFGYEDDSTIGADGLSLKLKSTTTGAWCYLIGVFDGKISTLAHEVAHACFFIFGDVGETVEEGRPNETFCYLLDYLVDKLIVELLKSAVSVDAVDKTQ